MSLLIALLEAPSLGMIPDPDRPDASPAGARGQPDFTPSSDDRLHQLLDRTVAFAALLTPEGVLEDVSQNALEAGGLGRAEVIGRPFWETYWWSHDPQEQDRLRAAIDEARSGRTLRYDAVARTANDGRLPIAFQLAPMVGLEGRVSELVASAVDISDRVASQARLEELVREMSHRVKNLLSTVRAMARMTERSSGPNEAFRDFLARLDALDAAHDALSESHTAEEFFTHLGRRLLAPYMESGVTRITIAGPALRLARDEGKMLGLCIYELATNAAKYGALSSDTGRVSMVLTAPGANGRASFTWRESEGPPVSPPRRTGYGTQFLATTLEALFRGPVEFDYTPEGFALSVSGPADSLFAARDHSAGLQP